MDFNALQHKLFSMDPTDPKEDLAKLQAQAQGGQKNVAPTKNYVQESVEVAPGSMPLGIDSVADFAALAGVRLDEKQKMGSAGQAKGRDPMPSTSTPSSTGEQPHPLKDKLVGEEDDPFIKSIDDTFGQGTVAKTIGFSPRGELTKLIYKAIKAVMPDADDATIDKAAKAAANTLDEDVVESGLQYYTGVKKHGKEYMKKAAQAGREGASQEELGRLRDKYSKAEKKKNESSIASELYKALTEKGL